jgi:hypothetical protein
MLAGVGQPLLDDAVQRAAHGLGHRRIPLHQVGELDVHAALAGLLDQGGEVVVRRLRPADQLAGAGGAQDAQARPEVVERLVRLGLDDSGAGADLVGRQVVAVGEGAGVQGDLGDPVGEYVVHLPGDPGAFVAAGVVHPELLLGLGPLGALAEGPQDLATRADVHAPTEHGDGDDHVEQEGEPDRVRALQRLGVAVALRGHDADQSDQGHGQDAAPGRERDGGQHGWSSRNAGDQAEGRGDERHRQRPTPPEHDQDIGNRPGAGVQPEQGAVAVPLPGPGLCPHQRREHQAHREPPDVGVPPQLRLVMLRSRLDGHPPRLGPTTFVAQAAEVAKDPY